MLILLYWLLLLLSIIIYSIDLFILLESIYIPGRSPKSTELFPFMACWIRMHGMLDQDAWHAGSGCYQRTLACLYRASLPLEVLCPTIGTTPFHVSFAWLLREEPKQMLSLPPILLCCGDKDFLLSSSKGVASRRNAMGYSATLRIYPGHHAFLGLPPGWTFHRCFENSIPCANDVLMQILQS